MKDYRVTWEIDISAENPLEAAIQARKIQTAPGFNSAVVFDCIESESGDSFRVDLLDVPCTPDGNCCEYAHIVGPRIDCECGCHQ